MRAKRRPVEIGRKTAEGIAAFWILHFHNVCAIFGEHLAGVRTANKIRGFKHPNPLQHTAHSGLRKVRCINRTNG